MSGKSIDSRQIQTIIVTRLAHNIDLHYCVYDNITIISTKKLPDVSRLA